MFEISGWDLYIEHISHNALVEIIAKVKVAYGSTTHDEEDRFKNLAAVVREHYEALVALDRQLMHKVMDYLHVEGYTEP